MKASLIGIIFGFAEFVMLFELHILGRQMIWERSMNHQKPRLQRHPMMRNAGSLAAKLSRTAIDRTGFRSNNRTEVLASSHSSDCGEEGNRSFSMLWCTAHVVAIDRMLSTPRCVRL